MTERRFIPISVKIFIQIVLFLLYIKKNREANKIVCTHYNNIRDTNRARKL